jgi:hypothetical protein
VSEFLTRLEKEKGYHERVTFFDYRQHMDLALNGGVWDITNGTILRLAEGKIVSHAVKGYKALTKDEIVKLYGEPPVFKHLQWPETNKQIEDKEGAHWTLMTFSDYYKIPIICHVVHLMEQEVIKDKTYMQFAFDLSELCYKQQEFPLESTDEKDKPSFGRFISQVVDNPSKYIQP